MFLSGDEEVVAILFDAYAQALEGGRDDAEMLLGNLPDAYAVAHHCCHADEGAYLDHVGQDGVLSAVKC